MNTARQFIRTSAALGLLCASGWAQAHTGHGTHSLLQGLAHPLGLDHLLAMLAVGLWSASTLAARQRWQGPALFLAALLGGALLGWTGVVMPGLELSVAASVVVFGLMLLARQHLPRTSGLALVAAGAMLHGLAHGAETPLTGFAPYAAGFVASTMLLLAAGMALGLALQVLGDRRQTLSLRALGTLLGTAGLGLMSQLA